MRFQDNTGSSRNGTPAAGHQDAPSSPGGLTLNYASIDRVCRDPTLCDLQRIRDAVDRANYDDATVRAFVRIMRGFDVPPELLIDVLIAMDMRYFSVFIALARDVPQEKLMAELVRGRFGDGLPDVERTVFAAAVVWMSRPSGEAGGLRGLLVPILRRMSSWGRIPLLSCALLGWLTVQIDDAHLRQGYEQRHGAADCGFSRLVGTQIAEMCQAPIGALVGYLLQNPVEPLLNSFPAPTSPRKIGRNELCPCGSGKKVKRCHDDQVGAIEKPPPSRISDLSARLDPGKVPDLQRSIVAALDLRLLRDETLVSVIHYLAFARDWDRARRVRDEIARRRGWADADLHWFGTIYEAIRAGQVDVARELFQELQTSAVPKGLEFELEFHQHHERNREVFAVLESAASMVVRGGQLGSGELAMAALHTMPALGILLARGAYPDARDADREAIALLIREIEDARAKLGLPPNDPATEMYGLADDLKDDEGEKPEQTQLSVAAADLQVKLEAANEHNAELARQVAELKHQMPLPSTAAAPAPTDADRVRQMQRRIDEREALIREGNAERAELRRQLEALGSRGTSTPARPPRSDSGDEDMLVEVPAPSGRRPVLLPSYGASFLAVRQKLSSDVIAAAVALSGRLAAGETAAWRPVKMVKGMPYPLLMARIGIHHRLLFRADEGALEVLDLVTREGLMTTLKRLRGA